MKQVSQDAGGPVAEDARKKQRTKQWRRRLKDLTVIGHSADVEGDM